MNNSTMNAMHKGFDAYANGMMMPEYPALENIKDIQNIECVPLDERIKRWDFALNLLDGCKIDPDKTAIFATHEGNIDGEILQWRFSQLHAQTIQIANFLRDRGFQASDPIAIISPTTASLFGAFMGTLLACRPFPINWMYERTAIADLLTQANVKAVIALGPTPGFQIHEEVTAALQSMPNAPELFTLHDPFGKAHDNDLLSLSTSHGHEHLNFDRPVAHRHDIACYVHSGGTTGQPKIVKILHQGMVYRQWAASFGLAFTPNDVILSDTPLFHIGGLLVRGLVSTADGHTTVIPSLMGARDKRYIANYWRYVERFGITQISGVPTTLSVLAKQPPTHENIASLRPYFATGSTAMAPSIQEKIAQTTGCNTLQSYGLTENTSHAALDPRDGKFRRGSSGLRVPYTQIVIAKMSPDGLRIERECQTKEVGMVVVKGPGVSGGYLNEDQNAGVFLSDGSLVTGDLGSLDEDGFIHISGRQKDIIIRGGHNIEPRVIEDALMLCPEVALAAAVGKPDAHAGELPIAYVQLQPNASASIEHLLHFASSHIPERVAIPKEIIILDQIPLTTVGKPQKHMLQIDAATRTFQEALSGIAGHWQLEVEHAGGGLLVKVKMAKDQDKTRQAIEQILTTFSTRHLIEET